MKRYTREFANAQLKTYEPFINTNADALRTYQQISRYAALCALGAITDFECVRQIVRLVDEAA